MGECKIKVTLETVTYSRKNIGNDWKYLVTLDCRGVFPHVEENYPEHIFNIGNTERLDSVLKETRHNSCTGPREGLFEFIIGVHATEVDIWWDDSNGQGDIFAFKCPDDARRTITLFVKERAWWRFWGRAAKLEFKFHFELECV